MLTSSQLKEVIASQGNIIKSINTGARRELLKEINQVDGFACIVTGIRRCGKSTLMLQLINALNAKHLFLNFEDIRLSGFEINDFNSH